MTTFIQTNDSILLKLILFLFLFFSFTAGMAQSPGEIKRAKLLFEGAWINKKEARHLTIFIEDDGYVTINDWTGNRKNASVDAYKAFIKNGKLIMHAETEHHAPYSEIRISGKMLIYQTGLPHSNQEPLEKIYFIRSKW